MGKASSCTDRRASDPQCSHGMSGIGHAEKATLGGTHTSSYARRLSRSRLGKMRCTTCKEENNGMGSAGDLCTGRVRSTRPFGQVKPDLVRRMRRSRLPSSFPRTVSTYRLVTSRKTALTWRGSAPMLQNPTSAAIRSSQTHPHCGSTNQRRMFSGTSPLLRAWEGHLYVWDDSGTDLTLDPKYRESSEFRRHAEGQE